MLGLDVGGSCIIFIKRKMVAACTDSMEGGNC